MESNLTDLKNITAEIKAINRQGTVLIGERIQKANDLLKPYRDGTFTQWAEFALGSKRTAYNLLSYYRLYTDLPSHSLRECFRKLPQKAAYFLASKDVELEEKFKIIENYSDSSADELIMLIQDRFPTDLQDGRRKEANRKLLDAIEHGLKKLMRRKAPLSPDALMQLARIQTLVESIQNTEQEPN